MTKHTIYTCDIYAHQIDNNIAIQKRGRGMIGEEGTFVLRKSPFQTGKRYKDAIGRKWKIVHSYWLPKDGQADEYYIVRNWRKGLALAVHDTETTATVLLDDGFTTIYAEDEK